MEWNDYLSTGDGDVDDQHKELFRYIDEIGDAVRGKKSTDEVGKILQLTADYTKKHFDFEEAMVRRLNCPMQDVNKKAHEEFKQAIKDLTEEFNKQGGTLAIGIRIHRELTNWLFDHIVKVDKDMLADIKK